MKIHFIAIGGSAMHSLAIALKNVGHEVTGSDDEIFEPSRSRLLKHGLLPEKTGWFEEKITPDVDLVVLGMHAHPDNPELKKAQSLGIKILSFPELVYEMSKEKTRIAIAGSHGKTTTTGMLISGLSQMAYEIDYLCGSIPHGFDNAVKITDCPAMVIEADEYLTSALQPVPKFLFYRPQIAVITGIAWDHFNVFKTFDDYVLQFDKFIDTLLPGSTLIYYSGDDVLRKLVENHPNRQIRKIPYHLPVYSLKNNRIYVHYNGREYPFSLIGEHNLLNLQATIEVVKSMNLSPETYLQSIEAFTGTKGRLEKVYENDHWIIYRDFAHSPSKVKATLEGAKKFHPGCRLVAIYELHTYSSLNKDFLPQYIDTTNTADKIAIFYNPHTLEIKRLPAINENIIRTAFGRQDIKILNKPEQIIDFISNIPADKKNVILLMSSGNFGNLSIEKLKQNIETNN